MFNVNCRLSDLREEHNTDTLEVISCKYDPKTKIEQIYIRITPGENPSKAVEMLVNASDLHQAINHAAANESWETIRRRTVYRRYVGNEEDE